MQRAVRTAARPLVLSLLMLSAVALLASCSGNAMKATIGLPTSEAAPAHGESSAAPPGPPPASGQSNALVVTDRQRAYLSALAAEGVKPSSDLHALSIGSYICQARAAEHDDREVWDAVFPLVRGDISQTDNGAMGRSPVDVNAVTSDYIRIATERLC